MYKITNISPHDINLLKLVSDVDIVFVTVPVNGYITVSNIHDFINLKNLLDPRLGLFKISLLQWKDVI